MNSDRLNKWLTLIANIGVLVGLVVLVYEVRQNTQALQNQADVAIWSIGAEQANVVVDNPSVAEIMLVSETEGLDALTPVDQLRLSVLYFGFVDRLELQHRLYARNGVELDRGSIVFPENLLGVAAFREWWDKNKHIYHPDFIPYFEELLRSIP